MRKVQRRKGRKRKGNPLKGLTKLNLNAAGIDIGSAAHYVAVPQDSDPKPVQKFMSYTNDLYRLANWLEACGVETVAMESTGVYWIPIFDILQERGFEVILVNARHVKNVPGRKTDVLDCQWLQQLHTYGLLRGSFRPDQEFVILRSYVRQRDMLVQDASSHIQHMQKALSLMNIQLHNVISDITGVTGMRILRAIVGGNYQPNDLAQFRDPRCKASIEEITESLTGYYRPEHIFSLNQALQLYDFYQERIQECDSKIEAILKHLENTSPQREPLTHQRKRHLSKTEPRFEIRSPLYALTGVDLTSITSIGPHSALKIISEIGTDMTRWPSKKHFASWATLAPHNKITGGKVRSSRTIPSNNRVATALRLAAMNVGRSQTALGAFYRRKAAQIGKAKAITATAHKLAQIIYSMIKKGTTYQEPGADLYELQYRKRVIKNLKKRAKNLGFQLVPSSPVTEGVS
jgi:transposase